MFFLISALKVTSTVDIIIIIIYLFKVGFLTVISLDKLFTPTR